VTFKVLFVCSANVCRSPSAALLLSKALLGSGAFTDVLIQSAGTDAVSGQPRCSYCLRHIEASRPELEPLVSGRARAATGKRIGVADLVLAADRDSVGKVLRANPRSRPGVFTMIEAAKLAGRVVSGLTDETAASFDRGSIHRMADPASRLRWLVQEMDALRGEIPLTDVGRLGRLLNRHPDDPTDILDVHSRGDRAHRKMLRDVTGVTGSIAKAVIAVHQVPVPSAT
jgi:protein-tyrosine phosphatase